MGLVLVGVVVVGVVAIGFMLMAEQPFLRIVLGGALLVLGLLSLYFSWYLLNERFRGFEGVMPGLAVFAFIVCPFGIACLVTSTVMLTKGWSGSSRHFAPLAVLLVCLVFVVAYGAFEVWKGDREQVRKWVDRQGIRNANDCSSAWSVRAKAICRKIVSARPPESAESIQLRGKKWAADHWIKDPDECRRSTRHPEQFDGDPGFIAGCIEVVANDRHSEGVQLGMGS